MTRTYQELRAYSAMEDCMTSRISMTDDNRQEFFMLVPDRDPTPVGAHRRGGLRRALRAAACEAIQEAIDAGLMPGEVRVTPGAWRDMVAEQFAEQIRERAA